LGIAALWAALASVPAWAQGRLEFGAQYASPDTRNVAQWVVASRDHSGLPFAIVDKKQAHIYVFDAGGRLAGGSAVLLGQTVGDRSAPLVGVHTQAGYVPVDERTTPSGRFETEPGLNLDGDPVVWVDYATALAIHRLRPGASRRAREARLASATPDDNRASLGCIVVPQAFYERVLQPLLGRSRGVVYVLPDERSLHEIFTAL
jgi:hypothetical protein